MKCWLASFPRSGNTFFRNILYYVYGIESSSWHKEPNKSVKEGYDQYDFIKTHLLPDKIVPKDPKIPAIYLVRDGRDSLVSLAHHRSDIVSPGSDFSTNLYEAITAEKKSFFGGWSHNITAWLERATVVIRYEDLIKDQKGVFKRVEQIIPLPQASWDNLPNFKEMKFGKPKYGGKKPKKFFRKGKSGSWQDEMSQEQLELFWHFHGDTMERLGYSRVPSVVPQNRLLDSTAMAKMDTVIPESDKHQTNKKKQRVLIDCNLFFTHTDNPLTTNLKELLLGLLDAESLGNTNLNVDLLIKDRIYPIQDFPNLKLFKGKSLIPFKRLSLNNRSIHSRNLPKYALIIANKYHSLLFLNDLYRLLTRLIQKRERKKAKTRLLSAINKTDIEYDLIHLTDDMNIPDLENFEIPVVLTKSAITFNKNLGPLRNKNVQIIATSEIIRDKLEEEWSIPSNKIHKIYLQGDKRTFHLNLHPKKMKTVLSRFNLRSQNFIICDSNHESSTSLLSIVKGFNIYQKKSSSKPIQLVIIGKGAQKRIPVYKNNAKTPNIIFTGHVKNHFRHVLHSSALLSYSLTDRLSPPYEALYCRTPVIYNKENPFKEILHNCGLPVDAKDPADIADTLNYLINDASLISKFGRNALYQSNQYSRRKTTYDTLQVYITCLKIKEYTTITK